MSSFFPFNTNYGVKFLIIFIPILASYKVFEISKELNLINKSLNSYNFIVNLVNKHHDENFNKYINHKNFEINQDIIKSVVVSKKNNTINYTYYIKNPYGIKTLQKMLTIDTKFSIYQNGGVYKHSFDNVNLNQPYFLLYEVNLNGEKINQISHEIYNKNFVSKIIQLHGGKTEVKKIYCGLKKHSYASRIIDPKIQKYTLNIFDNENNITINLSNAKNKINNIQLIQFCYD